MTRLTRLSRREFLAIAGVGAAGALVLGVHSASDGSRRVDAPKTVPPAPGTDTAAPPAFAPNVWLSIDADGDTTIWLAKAEMGQGVYTSLPMLIAEELDADLSRIRIRQAIVEPRFVPFIGTGGSSSVPTSWEPLRRAGAAAREMLVSAAAAAWNVPTADCRTEPGVVIHPATGRRAAYGTLADAASRLPVPEKPRLKERAAFRLIGTRMPRLDGAMKVDGSGVYGIDVRPPGLLFAVLARCPVYGGTRASFDATRTKAIAGVRHVVPVSDYGVAVVADTTWAALEGRRVLDVRWNDGPNGRMDSAALERLLDGRTTRTGVAHRNDGDAARALRSAHRTITATYATPFVAHGTIEPVNATAHVEADRCTIWGPFQYPDGVQEEAVKITGLPAAAITIHTTLLGGGFGRKAYADFAIDALLVSKALGVPVQVLFSREDDIQHDMFRPPSRHVMAAGFDRDGRLLAWRHRIVAPSLRAQWDWGKNNPDIVRGLDEWATGVAGDVPYRAPNFRVEFVMTPTPVPVGAWRSIYCAQTSFGDECFVDELANAMGKDPYEFRLDLMGDAAPAHRAVLERAAKEAGWGQPLPAGRARGMAVYKANDSFVAQIAEVSVAQDGTIRVHRVVCAIDCGIVVNPDGVEAQMEGSILFGLSATLMGEITFDRGRCQQSNFHDAPLLRLPEAPAIDVHIVASDRAPAGVGEPGVPPIAPAVANAVSAAIGRRIRRLPLTPASVAAAMAAN